MTIQEKLDLIEFQFNKKVELESIKFDFFKKKNDMINKNVDKIWRLKNDYQNKKHKQQVERIKLVQKK